MARENGKGERILTSYFKIFVVILTIARVSGMPAIAQDASPRGVPMSATTPEQLQKILLALHDQGERIKEVEAALAVKSPPSTPRKFPAEAGSKRPSLRRRPAIPAPIQVYCIPQG